MADAPRNEGAAQPLTLTYTWERETLAQALEQVNLHRARSLLYWRPNTVLMAVCSLLFLLLAALRVPHMVRWPELVNIPEVSALIVPLTAGLALSTVWLPLLRPFVRSRVARELEKGTCACFLEGRQTVHLSPEGLEYCYGAACDLTPWKQVRTVWQTGGTVAVYLRGGGFRLIRCDASAQAVDQCLRQYIGK